MPASEFGYRTRPPYPDEAAFFQKSPAVAGYAADDNFVVLNPYASLTDQERRAVVRNEAVRLAQRNLGMSYDFPLTDGQQKFFKNTPYAGRDKESRETVVARILSGDPSAKDFTADQRAAADITLAHAAMAAPKTNAFPEQDFRSWYSEWAKQADLDPNPDAPEHKYDYRAAYDAGAIPSIDEGDGLYHWPSAHKAPDHPNRFIRLPGGGVLDSLLDKKVD